MNFGVLKQARVNNLPINTRLCVLCFLLLLLLHSHLEILGGGFAVNLTFQAVGDGIAAVLLHIQVAGEADVVGHVLAVSVQSVLDIFPVVELVADFEAHLLVSEFEDRAFVRQVVGDLVFLLLIGVCGSKSFRIRRLGLLCKKDQKGEYDCVYHSQDYQDRFHNGFVLIIKKVNKVHLFVLLRPQVK